VLNSVQREKEDGRHAYQSKFERCNIERGITRGGYWRLASKVGAGSGIFKVSGRKTRRCAKIIPHALVKISITVMEQIKNREGRGALGIIESDQRSPTGRIVQQQDEIHVLAIKCLLERLSQI
jgi:hypothetical protein